PWMAPSERRPLIVEARAYLTVYLAVAAVSIAAWSPAALVVWILPWMVGQAFLRPYLLAEHTACAFTPDCLENTRTTLTWPLVKLFAWNMPYHAEIENLEAGYALSALDIGIWDVTGKAAGLPLAKLWGAVADRVPAYGSGGWGSYSLDDLIGEAKRYTAMGCRYYKMKIHHADPLENRRRVE